MTSSAKSENVDLLGNAIDVAMLEAEFRKGKARAKSNFTRSRNNLLLMVEYQSLPSRNGIRDACHNMDMCMETVMDVLSSLTTFHLQNKEIQKANVVVSEMEEIEKDFTAAYETAWVYFKSQVDDTSSILLDSFLIDPERRSIIKDADTDTYRKELEITSNRTLDKVGTFDQNKIRDSIHKVTSCTSYNLRNNLLQTETSSSKTTGVKSVEHMATKHCAVAEPGAERNHLQNSLNAKKTHQNDATDCFATPTIGHDLWTQLKQVEIPTFSGDKRTYPSWKAAFMACVDSAPVAPEYKMLQLRQYVSGEVLHTVESLGYSPTATRLPKTVWKESMAASAVKYPFFSKTWSSSDEYSLAMHRN